MSNSVKWFLIGAGSALVAGYVYHHYIVKTAG